MKEQIIEVENVEVSVKPCDHCKHEPIHEDVVSAVKRAQEHRACPQYRCVYCGETIRAVKYKLWHDSSGWIASEQEIESCLSMSQIHLSDGPPIHQNNGLHLRCVIKAMPFFNGLTAQKT